MKQNYKIDKVFNNKARKFFENGDYNKALSFINKAIKINPDNARYCNNKGLCFKKSGEYEEAIKWFDKATDIEVNNAK